MNTTEKKSRHVHADIIKAWLDGAEVEYWAVNDRRWYPVAMAENSPTCLFSTHFKYRIKPKPVTIRYRVALFKDKGGTFYTGCYNRENGVEEVRSFVKWLTDWVEVEVPSDHVLPKEDA